MTDNEASKNWREGAELRVRRGGETDAERAERRRLRANRELEESKGISAVRKHFRNALLAAWRNKGLGPALLVSGALIAGGTNVGETLTTLRGNPVEERAPVDNPETPETPGDESTEDGGEEPREEAPETDPEEEKRLLYVAMTRAEEQLFLTHSRQRMIFGEKYTPDVSPFIETIPEECLNLTTIHQKKTKTSLQKKLF